MKRVNRRTGAVAALMFSAVATTLAALAPETGGTGGERLQRFLQENPVYAGAVSRSEAEFGGAVQGASVVSIGGRKVLEIALVTQDGRRMRVRYDPASGTLSSPEGHKFTLRDVATDAVST